jgi:hypothetical protein
MQAPGRQESDVSYVSVPCSHNTPLYHTTPHHAPSSPPPRRYPGLLSFGLVSHEGPTVYLCWERILFVHKQQPLTRPCLQVSGPVLLWPGQPRRPQPGADGGSSHQVHHVCEWLQQHASSRSSSWEARQAGRVLLLRRVPLSFAEIGCLCMSSLSAYVFEARYAQLACCCSQSDNERCHTKLVTR